tara:strand:+ start:100 stop:951 length:852 start_codon:yes stop_codon:yes gene_type:complete
MNKIIWISSFPKSGNTWLRLLISNYFYNNKGLFDPNVIGYIPKFPLEKYVQHIRRDLGSEISINNISKVWVKNQELLSKEKGRYIFVKNHNAFLKIRGHELSNENFSAASIYLIRDPRDVVVSYAKWMQKSYDEIISQCILSDLNNLYYVKGKSHQADIEIIGSWKINYISWKNGMKNIPKIIIKYEDLLENTSKCFQILINFLSKIMNFPPDVKKMDLAINNSNFEKLQKFEKENKFLENKNNPFKFFRKGESEQWKKELNKIQISKIEEALSEEMKELGYL